MAKKTECYVDTSAFIAFLDKSDSFHPLFRRLFSDPPPLITSSLVIAEGHGWFLRRYWTALGRTCCKWGTSSLTAETRRGASWGPEQAQRKPILLVFFRASSAPSVSP